MQIPTQPVEPALAPIYQEILEEEKRELNAEQLEKILEDLDFELNGDLLATLHLIRRHMKELNWTYPKLQEHFNVSSSAISHWFNDGEISATYYAQLVRIPEFCRVAPSARDCQMHGYRRAMKWLRTSVLCEAGVRRYPTLEELLTMCQVHQMNETEIDVVFSNLSETMTIYKNSGALLSTLQDWAPSYRLLCDYLEV